MSECMTQEDAERMDNEQAIAILKPLRDMMCDQYGCPISDAYFAVGKAIEALSQPQRIKGKWIDGGDEEYGAFKYHVWRCSECGDEVVENGKPQENFCAMCGADMRETE